MNIFSVDRIMDWGLLNDQAHFSLSSIHLCMLSPTCLLAVEIRLDELAGKFLIYYSFFIGIYGLHSVFSLLFCTQ